MCGQKRKRGSKKGSDQGRKEGKESGMDGYENMETGMSARVFRKYRLDKKKQIRCGNVTKQKDELCQNGE